MPRDTPWVFETGDGELLHAGITTSGGAITIPVPAYVTGYGSVDFVLSIYKNGAAYTELVRLTCWWMSATRKSRIQRDFDHPTHNVIYIPEMYMLYPMTAPVIIDDVTVGRPVPLMATGIEQIT